MCCLFGILDYGGKLSRKEKTKILSVLSVACEERGTDATGIAYNTGGSLKVYKRPLPAHLLWFRIFEDTNVVMGRTRMTTQGSERFNANNHPFAGQAGDTTFALAHNGVLSNDKRLRRQYDIDKASGKNAERPELIRMMEFVRVGDTIVVESISRFARNTRDLLELVERLTAKGVEFVSKKESIDTSSPTGKFMLTVFGAVAELERAYILERQREGIAIAKAKGVYKGRPPKELPDFDRIVTLWQVGEITAVEAARRLQINPSTFYRKLKGVKKQ